MAAVVKSATSSQGIGGAQRSTIFPPHDPQRFEMGTRQLGLHRHSGHLQALPAIRIDADDQALARRLHGDRLEPYPLRRRSHGAHIVQKLRGRAGRSGVRIVIAKDAGEQRCQRLDRSPGERFVQGRVERFPNPGICVAARRPGRK